MLGEYLAAVGVLNTGWACWRGGALGTARQQGQLYLRPGPSHPGGSHFACGGLVRGTAGAAQHGYDSPTPTSHSPENLVQPQEPAWPPTDPRPQGSEEFSSEPELGDYPYLQTSF